MRLSKEYWINRKNSEYKTRAQSSSFVQPQSMSTFRRTCCSIQNIILILTFGAPSVLIGSFIHNIFISFRTTFLSVMCINNYVWLWIYFSFHLRIISLFYNVYISNKLKNTILWGLIVKHELIRIQRRCLLNCFNNKWDFIMHKNLKL